MRLQWLVYATIVLLLGGCAGDPADSALLPGGGGTLGGLPDCTAASAQADTCGGGYVLVNPYQTDWIFIAADADEPGGAAYQYRIAYGSSAPASDPDDGRLNTGTLDGNHPAAQACADSTRGGFTDWYLPARNELNVVGSLADFRASGPAFLPGLTAGVDYWSSTEEGSTTARPYSFTATNLTSGSLDKTTPARVRCVRRVAR